MLLTRAQRAPRAGTPSIPSDIYLTRPPHSLCITAQLIFGTNSTPLMTDRMQERDAMKPTLEGGRWMAPRLHSGWQTYVPDTRSRGERAGAPPSVCARPRASRAPRCCAVSSTPSFPSTLSFTIEVLRTTYVSPNTWGGGAGSSDDVYRCRLGSPTEHLISETAVRECRTNT